MRNRLVRLVGWLMAWDGSGVFFATSARVQAIRILPVGDSITPGGTGSYAYRLPVWQMLHLTGIPVGVVGWRSDFCGEGRAVVPVFDCNHEGHAGWGEQDVLDDCTPSDPCGAYAASRNQGTVSAWSALYRADIALVHIGTCDILQRTNPFDCLDYLWLLADALRSNNPSMHIYAAQILPINGRIGDTMPRHVFVLVVGMLRSTPASPITVVDMFTRFDPVRMTSDGIHPHASGDQWMAFRWYSAHLSTYGAN